MGIIKQILSVIIVFGIVIFLVLSFVPSAKEVYEENTNKCKEDCIENDWETGEWLGFDLCKCHNITGEIIEQKE